MLLPIRLFIVLGIGLVGIVASLAADALPEPEDIPEEILRIQPSLAARSPIDNQPLTPSQYQQLQQDLRERPSAEPEVAPEVKRLIFLLKLRKAYRSIFPFL
ncbi:MAG: hypothetical protein NW237_08875 [Cyanobacteriota bacterium]|nr:hypothetical protein [Cyanobacteriota bacterium]